ncbi:AAA family ATPase [Halorubrum kocurii]|uniref:AAA family ATPase n=1 Tax=Halorubrum kocurii TaxID=478441 RepID=UPI000A70DAB0|nr:AAA family ATPase [Halorubrum kocurii]
MDLGVLGLGSGGNRIVDSMIQKEFTEGSHVIYEAIGIDSSKSDIAGLEYISKSKRVTVGLSEVGGHGVGSNLEMGSDIVSNEEREIASAISNSMLEEVDAYLVVTCAGGGMAGGASTLIDLFRAIDTKPVYAAVVLPHMGEGGLCVLNACLNVNTIYPSADGVFLFDNGHYYDNESDNFRREDATEAFSSQLLGLFSFINTESKATGNALLHDEINTMLGSPGIAAVGCASTTVTTGSQGTISRFLGEEANIDPDEATEELTSLTKAAADDVGVLTAYDNVPTAIFFISGPQEYLNSDAIRLAEQKVVDPNITDVTIRTTVNDSSTLEVVVGFAGITEAPILNWLEQIYDESGEKSGTTDSRPPFRITNHSSNTTENQDDTTGSVQQPKDDTPTTSDETVTQTEGAEHTEQSIPDPSDVQGVDRPPERSFDDVIGLSDVKERIKEDVLIPARDDRFDEYGIGSVTGVLFHGPPGTGKTYVAKATAGELGYNYMEVDPSDIKSQYVGGGSENVNELFERAKTAQPTLIFIDEIDSIAGERSETGGMTQSERSMINELLGELSKLNESEDDVIVVAATNTLDDVDTAIKRSGRFDTTIHIGAPDFETRYGILQSTLDDGPPNELTNIDSDVIRSKTDGLVSSDMAEIGKSSIRKALAASQDGSTPVVRVEYLLESIEEIVSKRQQDNSAAKMIQEPPEIDFNDVAGMDGLKRKLSQTIIDPAENPEKYEQYGLDITNGVLLYGPPGTGKTYLSKAVAGELEFNLISITASDVVSKWIGEGTQNVGELFETALDNQPSIVFIDEIDAIASQRGGGDRMHQDQKQIVNEILTGMSEVQGEDVVVIAATNLRSSLDDALTRSGRFDETIEVPPPDDEARIEMLKYHLSDRPLATDKINWEEIKMVSRKDANGHPYVASDMKLITETAARVAMNQGSKITQDHLWQAIEDTDASHSTYN